MCRLLLAIFSSIFLAVSVASYAESNPDSFPEMTLLNTEGAHVLDVISTLRQEAADLQEKVDKLWAEMEKAKESLKRISAASRPARRYAQILKKGEAEYQALVEQLHQKRGELKAQEVSLAIIESKMNWMEQDSTSGELIEIVSRFVAP